MILVNGNSQECLSVLDRGLAYGDGLFETIAVHDGKPLLLDLHWQRLETGCKRLKIPCPEISLLDNDIKQLLADANRTQQSRCVIKIILTRGGGGRGYRFDSEQSATRIAILSGWPQWQGTEQDTGVKLRVCETRLSAQPLLSGIKHLNRLEQVMARSEWTDNDIVEGIMLDAQNNIIEGTMSNIFFVDNQQCIISPALNDCGVAGVQRENILHLAKRAGFNVNIMNVPLNRLPEFSEVFITNSLIGVWPVTAIDKHVYACGTITRALQQ